jgi:hypothetical protein
MVFTGFSNSSVEIYVDYFRQFQDETWFFYLVKTYPFLVAVVTPYLSITIE